MLNFTPPIKVSLFITLVYIICFRFFIQTGNFAWLYPANILLAVCMVLYILFLNSRHKKMNIMTNTTKGSKVSLITSLLCFFGAAMIVLVNYYVSGSQQPTRIFSNRNGATAIVFTNALLVNFVCGSLASFITAGLINEKNTGSAATHLPSVK